MGYAKGAEVLQMLENEIGADGMKKALRQWLIDHRQGELGEWEDFEAAVAKSTGESYKWFFDQWLRRPGYARFSFRNWKWAKGKLTGVCEFAKSGYRMTLDALVKTADGESFAKAQLKPTGDPLRWTISFPVAKKPSRITIDPWQKVLRAASDAETRVTLSEVVRKGLKLYADEREVEWVKVLTPNREHTSKFPSDPNGWMLVAHPKTTAKITPWLAKVGVTVTETSVTYRGTTVDLRRGGFVGVVDLGGGKQCVIALGNSRRRPSAGAARAILFDEFGRCLRATTDPIRTGPLTYSL